MNPEDININKNQENKDTTEPSENGVNQPQIPTPPPVKREFEVEEEWAEKLGMHFDEKQVKRDSQAPQPDSFQQAPPPYPGMQTTPPPVGPGMNETQIPRREPMPPTYLVWSILATLCCCMPAGIAAIIFSASVSSKYYAADYEGAKRASRQAEIWIIVAIVAGIITNALYLPLTLLLPS